MEKANSDFLKVKNCNDGEFSNYKNHIEAMDYQGCEYIYSGHKYIQRTSKVTPKKIGQFVTLWKRDSVGTTTPLDTSDNLDYVVIICSKDGIGRFLFPREVLIKKGIISSGTSGKRGFRVYPIWDKPTSKQALLTQKWQLEYFSNKLKIAF